MRFLLACLVFACVFTVSPSVHAQSASDQRLFVDRAIAALENAGAQDVSRTGPLALQFSLAGVEDATANLDNAWQAYRANPGAADAIIAHYVGSLTAALQNTARPIDPDRVMPVIRHVAFVQAMMQRADPQADGDPMAGRPSHAVLNEELALLFVEDSPNTVRFLSQADVAGLSIAPEALFQKALENLFAQLPGINRSGGRAVIMVRADGNYESSLMLAEGLFAPENFPLEGAPVFAIPSRDVLLVTGADDPAGLAEMRAMTADIFSQTPYAISDQLFIRAPDGNLVIFTQR